MMPVLFASLMSPSLFSKYLRPAEAAAAAAFEHDPVALGQAKVGLAFDLSALARGGHQGDPERGTGHTALEPVGRNDPPLEHAGQRNVAAQHAVLAHESVAAAMRACTARAAPERLPHDLDGIFRLDHLGGCVHHVRHVHADDGHAVAVDAGALAAAMGLVERRPG